MKEDNVSYALLGLLIEEPELLQHCQILMGFTYPFPLQWQSTIFEDIQQLYNSTGGCDSKQLMRMGREKNIPYERYTELIKQAGLKQFINSMVEEVFDDMVKRDLVALGSKLFHLQTDPLLKGADFLREITDATDSFKGIVAVKEVSLEAAHLEVITKAQRLSDGITDDYLKTGILSLDRLIHGFTKKTMSIIAARPSVGKSALGLTIQSNMDGQGIATGFLSVEMSEAECVERIIQIRSGISMEQFATKQASVYELQNFRSVGSAICRSRMQIKRTTDRRLGNIRNMIRLMKVKDPNLSIVFIDYIQKLMGSPKLDKRGQIDEISAALTDIAAELDIHICCLAQINRTGDDYPRMRDLKESGALEQDAHIVILIARNAEQCEEETSLLIVKNRSGRAGKVSCVYNSATTRFYDNCHDYAGDRNE